MEIIKKTPLVFEIVPEIGFTMILTGFAVEQGPSSRSGSIVMYNMADFFSKTNPFSGDGCFGGAGKSLFQSRIYHHACWKISGNIQ